MNDKDNGDLLLPEGVDASAEATIVIRFNAHDSAEFSFTAGRTTIQQWLIAADVLDRLPTGSDGIPANGATEIKIMFTEPGSARYHQPTFDHLPLLGQIVSAREWLEWRAKFFLSLSEAQKQQQAQTEMVKRMKLVQQLQRRPPV